MQLHHHAVHGEVACEHTSFDAEDFNHVPHYRTITFDTPMHALLADSGYLEPDVCALGELCKRGSPRMQAFDAPVGRQPRMVHDDRHAGEIPREFHGFDEVPPWRLKFEHQATGLEQRIPRAPSVATHRPWRGELCRTVAARHRRRLVPHASHDWRRLILAKHVSHVITVEPDLPGHRI